jgi:oligoendopeptidase F
MSQPWPKVRARRSHDTVCFFLQKGLRREASSINDGSLMEDGSLIEFRNKGFGLFRRLCYFYPNMKKSKVSPSQKKAVSKAPAAPKLRIKETWDFSALYSGIKDPKIESDLKECETVYTAFAKKYAKDDSYMSDAKKLGMALGDWKKLMEVAGLCRPLWYLFLMMELDTQDDEVKAVFNAGNERLTKSANQIVFFNLKLGKISPDNQRRFLDDPTLAEYRMYLSSIFEIARHNLAEGEEKILNLKHTPAHEMWVTGQQKLMTAQMVMHKSKGQRKMIPITQAMAIKADLPTKERRALHVEIFRKLKEISFFAEAEMNAVIANKRVNDDLRGFTKPYEATILGYQNSVKSVEALVAAVTKHLPDAQRFFKLKAKALGLSHLTLADTATKMLRSKKKYSLEQGVGMVHDAFTGVAPKFGQMFADFVAKGRVDFHPRKGKHSGAFCSGGLSVPTMILLNHTDGLGSIFTMAHEMGHAIHTELSKKQDALYQDYTISIAEVASTFFENVMFDYLYERASEKEKRDMLLENIQENVFTIHSQITYFNFETRLHEEIRKKGMLSAAEIAAMFLESRKSFIGKAAKYTAEDGYAFVYIEHFRSFFYVYAYAYGQLIANALYAEYKRNPAFLEKIEYFLSAGGSKKPDDIFKDIGIDVTKPDFFEKGLAEIAEKVRVAERLLK